MKKLYFITLLTTFFLFGCKSEFSQFNEDALNYASNDKRIDQQEFEKLIVNIKDSDERGFKIFKSPDGNIDNSKLVDYLLKYYTAKKIPLTSSDIWQSAITIETASKYNINVFMENSASMDGYVGINSSFKTTIFKLLTDLKNFSLADSLNLNYINTKPIPIKSSASRDDIDDFYKRLNPRDFKSAGGLRSSTDIEKMLKHIVDISDKDNLSVFISDCVFSPGKTDAKKYLDGQYAAIYNDFTSAIKTNPHLSVIILQCLAKFEGTYYDYFDKEHKDLNSDRPYYIWFVGTSEQIKNLVDYKIFDLIKNGYENKLVIQSINEINEPVYKILPQKVLGDFDRAEIANKKIKNASSSKDEKTKGQFGFNVVVDFSKSLQDAKYFLDTSNYKLSDVNYTLKIETIADKNDASTMGHTHKLKLTTNKLVDEILRIDIVGRTPGWVYSSTSPDDTKIDKDDSEKLKTFGLKYLIEGVCDAFYPNSSSNTVQTIKVTIQK